MRDPNRLDSFYEELKQLHKIYVPDWRFSQLLYNFEYHCGDIFYMEEDDFISAMKEYLEGLRKV